jgi:pyruvate/2-oxoglutarate dehydrogenase complex dihydrolipoamide dehydrogenase (E3) component
MDQYDLAVIGGGSAGLTAADFGVKLGVKVALIEKDLVGGDCTWTGCVPSKAILKVGNVVKTMQQADRFGLDSADDPVDFQRVMESIREVIQGVYAEESPEVLREAGIDVYLEAARFQDPHTIQIGEDKVIKAKRSIIATGARSFIPYIKGLDDVPYLTYETVWDIDVLPKRLLVLGAGSTGIELAQAFQRLGSQVTLINRSDRILRDAVPEASELLVRVLEEDGMKIRTGVPAEEIWQDEEGIHIRGSGQEIVGDTMILAVGRIPSVTGLGLEAAGVEFDNWGINTDNHLRTSQPNIYAAGDCTGGPQFTHVAGMQAYTAVRNALLPGASIGIIENPPWTLFTDPEISQVGLTPKQARKRHGKAVRVCNWPMRKVDRAHTEKATGGFIQVVYHKDGSILGATVAGQRSGELIHEWVLGIANDLKIGDVAFALHSYPTYAIANMEAAADIQTARTLSGFMGRVIKFFARR